MKPRVQPEGVAQVEGWSRADFLRRAAVGSTGLFLFGGAGSRLLGTGHARASTVTAEAAGVRRFVSRPDLQPPVVSILHGADRTASGLLFLAPSSGPGQRGVLIMDDAGDVVWFRPTSPLTAMDFRAGFYKGKPR